MPASPCFADAPPGLLDHGAGELLARHCHEHAFVAIVLEGGYQEAGDEGRWNVHPGDALIHHAYESHLDRFEAKGARVLVLPLPAAFTQTGFRGHVDDPDMLVRLAERDRRAASVHFAKLFVAAAPTALDWPDMLADDLRRLDPFALSEWAEAKGVRAETLSRGFRSAYGCTPKSYRANVRARAAFAAIRQGDGEDFAAIAHRLHFTDQAHMTHAVAGLTGAPPGWWRRRQMDTRQR